VLFHGVVGQVASQFRLDPRYVVLELSPWLMIAAGILCFAPVAWSSGRDPDSRYYPRARHAYMAWGLTLYLLGLALAAMVSQLAA
jgi:heme A synthase